MTHKTVVLAVLVTAGLSTAAGAESLEPRRAGTFMLGDWTASVYYTDSADDYEVVTTIASYQDDGVPIRFVSMLAPGQKKTVAIGSFGSDGSLTVLEIKRIGDEVSATVIPSDPETITQ